MLRQEEKGKGRERRRRRKDGGERKASLGSAVRTSSVCAHFLLLVFSLLLVYASSSHSRFISPSLKFQAVVASQTLLKKMFVI